MTTVFVLSVVRNLTAKSVCQDFRIDRTCKIDLVNPVNPVANRLDDFPSLRLFIRRLLRVLQEGKIRPVGSEKSKEINFNARVVVATTVISDEKLQKEDSAKICITALTYFRFGVPPCAIAWTTYLFSLMSY